jgi:L-ascorbate metabolism protein UlaG (beta-lactamase superfamily)
MSGPQPPSQATRSRDRDRRRTRGVHIPDAAGVDVTVRWDGIVPRLEPVIRFIAGELLAGRPFEAAIAGAERRHRALMQHFDTSSVEQFGLHRQHLFPRADTTAEIRMWNRATAELVSFDVGDDGWAELHGFLARCATGEASAAALRRAHPALADLVGAMVAGGMLVDAPPPPRVVADRPGVYRLQHASLLYRSRTTGVLVDPQLHASFRPSELAADLSRVQLESLVDAIVISHAHNDHWNLATLMSFPRDLPVIVPAVPRGSIVCPDLAAQLRSFGFTRVIVRDWYDPPVAVGDLRIHVLPFYGEQPLRDEAPRDPALYSWGNTYAIETDDYTSWFLIDSGRDDRGDMVDVARRVRDRLGPIDLVLGNLSVFRPYSPLYITGGGHYWLALTADQIQRFAAMRDHALTLGSGGVARVCAAVEARHYLPYANWWGPIGGRGAISADAHADDPAADEASHLGVLRGDLDALGAATAIVPWRIGDGFVADRGGGFEVQSLRLA